MSFLSTISLRQILALDAASSGGMGLLLLAGASLTEGLLGIPVEFQRFAGAILIPYAALVGWLDLPAATREAPAVAG